MRYTSEFPTHLASAKRFIAASLAVIGLAVGIASTPANAIGVVITNEPVVLDVEGITVTLQLPVGAELTHEELIALYDAIVGGSLFDFKENLEQLLLDDREGLLRFLEDLIQFTIIPFLEDVLDTLVGLVVTVKTNVDGLLGNICVTTGLPNLGETCVHIG